MRTISLKWAGLWHEKMWAFIGDKCSIFQRLGTLSVGEGDIDSSNNSLGSGSELFRTRNDQAVIQLDRIFDRYQRMVWQGCRFHIESRYAAHVDRPSIQFRWWFCTVLLLDRRHSPRLCIQRNTRSICRPCLSLPDWRLLRDGVDRRAFDQTPFFFRIQPMFRDLAISFRCSTHPFGLYRSNSYVKCYA